MIKLTPLEINVVNFLSIGLTYQEISKRVGAGMSSKQVIGIRNEAAKKLEVDRLMIELYWKYPLFQVGLKELRLI